MALQKTLKVFTSYLQKHFSCLLWGLLTLIAENTYSQTIVKEFARDSANTYFCTGITTKNKTIPLQYDTIVKIALLYFPELENTKIKIRIKKQASPLTARPRIFTFFRKATKRKYIITISNKTDSRFSAILLSNLSFNAQIGVVGHELSHISDYNKRVGFYFLKLLFMHLSKKKMDQFEYKTDMRCIEHGLGYKLLSWSKEVRFKLNLIQWNGIKHLNEQGRERYMNPESIMRAINQNQIYK